LSVFSEMGDPSERTRMLTRKPRYQHSSRGPKDTVGLSKGEEKKIKTLGGKLGRGPVMSPLLKTRKTRPLKRRGNEKGLNWGASLPLLCWHTVTRKSRLLTAQTVEWGGQK